MNGPVEKLSLLLLPCSLIVTACAPSEQVPQSVKSAAASGNPTSHGIGGMMDEYIFFEFAIYYLPKPSKDPLGEIDLMLRKELALFQRVDKLEKAPSRPIVAARIQHDAKSTYAPPTLQSLHYFGRGLTAEQAQALQQTDDALILEFGYPKEHIWDGLRSAVELVYALASVTNGLIWDEETREVFTPSAWEERRLKTWTEKIPQISKHTVVHAYKKDLYVRAISLGMAKFGLSDVVIDDFSWELERRMGIVLELFAQSMAEGAPVTLPGDFDLDFRQIKNPKTRDPQLTSLKPNATAVALLALKKGTWEEGDPKNRLIEITFVRGVGPDSHAKQDQVLSAAFGWEDSTKAVKHDEELLAASRQARAKLPGLREEFNKGFAPGEFIDVKAPFDRPDGGNEWMWVEVISWHGDKISGLLRNEPFDIPSLHAGQNVEVSESKVFDYLRRHADGTIEGNETSKLIEKQTN
jgi:uncharacterized protein YegJ (DUF2314 family)